MTDDLKDESFYDLYDDSPCGYFSFRENGTIVKMNATLLHLLGVDIDSAVGKLWNEFLTVGSKIFLQTHVLPLVKIQGFVKEINLDFRNINGTVFPALVNINRSISQNDQQFSAAVLDISQRKKFEDELILEKNKAEELVRKLSVINEHLTQFAYAVSHDLKEPLKQIEGFLSLVYTDPDTKLSQEGKNYLDFARIAGSRMMNLINGLLEFSKSKGTISSEEISVKEILQEVQSTFASLIEKEDITILIEENLPYVMATKVEVLQLFQNLLGNAIKFRDTNKKSTVIKINAIYEKQDFVTFTVQDNGIGIAAENIPKIFDIFKRLHSYQKYEGHGIGLSICKKITEGLGGRIYVTSELKVGTTFYVQLPVR